MIQKGRDYIWYQINIDVKHLNDNNLSIQTSWLKPDQVSECIRNIIILVLYY